MSDREPILEAKRRLPLPALMCRLELGDHAKKSARCPLHEDGSNSFSVWESPEGWVWKCHAGCGNGDEITFLEKVRGIDRGNAIRAFLDLAGVRPAQVEDAPAFDWSVCVTAFTASDARALAKARGYQESFVLWLAHEGLIGKHRGGIAFPVERGGKIVGCHYRAPNGGAWFFYPKGQTVQPLIIGDVAAAEFVLLFESQWDALAILNKFPNERARLACIVTRGAGNGKLVKGLVPVGKDVFAWKQNDEEKNGRRAGDVWLRDVADAVGVPVRWVVTPAPHKDANDWTRAGAMPEELFAAMGAAVPVFALESKPDLKSPMPVRSLDDLLGQVHAFLCDFVVFPMDEQADAITLWIAHTWVIEAFTFTPYLAINSPVKRCGKSTLLDCLKLLAKLGWSVVTPSPAVLYRKIEQDCPTLLWDEVDTVFTTAKGDDGREDLRAVLNSGFQRGTKVARCVGPTHTLMEFSVFCPKALAGIGRLPDTVADRSLPIVLARKGKSEVVAKFRYRDVSERAQELHEALSAWSQDPSVIPTLAAARPAIPNALGDRAADISEPLLALGELASGTWPDRAKKAVVKLTTGKANEDENLPIKLLTACREIFAESGESRLSSVELLTALVEREEDGPWAMWWEKDLAQGNTKGPAGKLSYLLKPFEIYPKVMRENGATYRGYDLEYFEPAFGRYLPTLEK